MPLVKAITKHGNSAGIILDQALLKVIGWDIGTEIEIHVRGNSIVLSRHKTAEATPSSPTQSAEK
jgi:antitoxin component of MazEF toxin-antitoxin module